jgi:hypothetical protein
MLGAILVALNTVWTALYNMQPEDLKLNLRFQSLPRPGDGNRSLFSSITSESPLNGASKNNKPEIQI